MFTVNILHFRGNKITHERLYVLERFEPAKWRAPWAETFGPFEAITPSDWRATDTGANGKTRLAAALAAAGVICLLLTAEHTEKSVVFGAAFRQRASPVRHGRRGTHAAAARGL